MVAPDIIVDEGKGTTTMLIPQAPRMPKVSIGVGSTNNLKPLVSPSAPPIITIGGQTAAEIMAILGGMHIAAAPKPAADDLPVHVVDMAPAPKDIGTGPLL